MKFEILPCHELERNGFDGLTRKSEIKMMEFMEDSRALMEKENKNVGEIQYSLKNE